jgi:hypothetical protein
MQLTAVFKHAWLATHLSIAGGTTALCGQDDNRFVLRKAVGSPSELLAWANTLDPSLKVCKDCLAKLEKMAA